MNKVKSGIFNIFKIIMTILSNVSNKKILILIMITILILIMITKPLLKIFCYQPDKFKEFINKPDHDVSAIWHDNFWNFIRRTRINFDFYFLMRSPNVPILQMFIMSLIITVTSVQKGNPTWDYSLSAQSKFNLRLHTWLDPDYDSKNPELLTIRFANNGYPGWNRIQP